MTEPQPPTPTADAPPPRWAHVVTPLVLLALGGTCGMTVLLALYQRFDHDEHQFVAPAILLWQGFVPFRDYLYLHMPTQVLLYAAVLPLYPDPFVITRLLAGAMGAAIAPLVWHYTWRRLGGGPWAAVAALGLAMLLATSEAFVHAVTRTWNHSSSVLFAAVAFLLLLRAAERERRALFILAGVALGVSIGCRLTVAPLLAPFGLGLLFLGHEITPRRVVERCLLFGGGVLLGLLPVIVLAAGWPERFLAGNFEYPQVSTLWHHDREGTGRWDQKLVMLVDQITDSRKHVLIVGLLAAATIAGAVALTRRGREGWREPAFALLVLLFVAGGAYAPGRLNLQYNFAPSVFAMLAVAAITGFLLRSGLPRRGPVAMAVFGVVVVGFVLLNYRTWIDDRRAFLDTSRWGVVRVAATAAEIERHAGGKHIVTLSPLFALMAGAEVDPVFANGPFPYRTAAYIERDRRFRLGWHGIEDFDDLFRDRPAEAYVTGLEYRHVLDQPIEARAAARGFVSIPLPAVDLRMDHEHPQVWVSRESSSTP